ncbi:MAG: Uma2 family endonuclease [Oscillatoriales cyanobacterium]|nr:MAG: Uma2 family endonuclease [Oscillatoriales cyanobacterium]
MTNLVLDLSSLLVLNDDRFWQLCQQNPDVQLERSPQGNLMIMAPTGGETGYRNGRLIQQLCNWTDRQGAGLGLAFDSSTGFKLPNGAIRSPDASWVRRDRWEALSPEARSHFVPLCPDFVVELMSPSDDLRTTQAKMQEYCDNGAQLSWLIDRGDRHIYIYWLGHDLECLAAPEAIAADPVLPSFVLDLQPIW